VSNRPRLSEFDTGEQRKGHPQNGIPAASNSAMAVARFLLAALWTVAASCHFTVSYPATIAPLDEKTEGNGPCGGADVNSRANVVEWPVAGAPVGFMSTHPSAKYHIMAALSNDTKAWKMLIPGLEQGGKVGFACLTAVPGVAAWVGQPAVVQIHQLSTDGSLFQVWARFREAQGAGLMAHLVRGRQVHRRPCGGIAQGRQRLQELDRAVPSLRDDVNYRIDAVARPRAVSVSHRSCGPGRAVEPRRSVGCWGGHAGCVAVTKAERANEVG